jgi:excisionase family DNA binding protein
MEGNARLLVTSEEAAEMLGIARSSLWKLIAEGRLRPVKIGRSTRIPVTDLERFVEELRGTQNGAQAFAAVA